MLGPLGRVIAPCPRAPLGASASDPRGRCPPLEAWADLGGPQEGRRFARRAASALSRVGRLVDNDAEGASIVDAAKQLQGRLESNSF